VDRERAADRLGLSPSGAVARTARIRIRPASYELFHRAVALIVSGDHPAAGSKDAATADALQVADDVIIPHLQAAAVVKSPIPLTWDPR
jgi:hypothetical protein